MDKVQIARSIENINKQLLELCDKLMGAEYGTDEAEALNVVCNAINYLENYLYPEYDTWSNEDLYLDDGE